MGINYDAKNDYFRFCYSHNMPESSSSNNEFLVKIKEVIEVNISNEQFGVSELADDIGMSRSNLLRKIKKETNLSVSQFIRQVRLESAMELLKETSDNVSEVSYKVGFNSISYFIKCFHDHYGYPPGEADKREEIEDEPVPIDQPKRKLFIPFIASMFFIVVVVAVLFYVLMPLSSDQKQEKSIAVLPFKNDSNDSTNVYLINGLMESILNNLQHIEDLRVISRTSVEKYRDKPKTAAEIAKELDVRYFVEGSGQKIDGQILLNIQLIEASSDSHLWAKQYSREAKDIFQLQREVAKDIANHIEAIITPEEEERIDRIPTNNLVAYDYFLKGQELFLMAKREHLEEAISYFEQAIEEDPEFALAYADVAIAYYYLDIFQTEKMHADQINYYADQALLFDSKLPQSLIAKALFYMHSTENELAVPYLEKALEYNPNSARVINALADFYANYVPNTGKYLEYALKGAQLDIASNDSSTASFIYLHLSNSFIQSGFTKEAEVYIDKSLEYNPDNLFSAYVKDYILYARDRDLNQLKVRLTETLQKDTNRLDILQEVGKVNYFLREYQTSCHYYKKFMDLRQAYNLDIYNGENAKIGVVLSKVGLIEESQKMFREYKLYADNDKSIYKHLSLSAYYSYQGNTDKAIEHLKLFSEQENYHYWIILFLEIDPLVDNIKNLPEFRKIMDDIKIKFWDSHEQIKISLAEKDLL